MIKVAANQTRREKPLPLQTVEFQKLASQKLRIDSSEAMDIAEKLCVSSLPLWRCLVMSVLAVLPPPPRNPSKPSVAPVLPGHAMWRARCGSSHPPSHHMCRAFA